MYTQGQMCPADHETAHTNDRNVDDGYKGRPLLPSPPRLNDNDLWRSWQLSRDRSTLAHGRLLDKLILK